MAPPLRYHHDFAALFHRGYSTRQIAGALGVPKSTVARRLKDAGLARTRSQGQIHGCRRETAVPSDWSFFPLTPEKSWLLGLIYGDGSLRKEGRGFVITSGDIDVLHNINRLFADRLWIRQEKGCATIQVNSVRLFQELATVFRLASCKAATLHHPVLLPIETPHFVRGLLDSDGSWSLDTRGDIALLTFRYTSIARSFVCSLRDTLVEHVQVSEKRRVTKGAGRSWTITYANHDAVRIGHWVYAHSTPESRCARKYARWVQFA
jgi:hypothetical protein